MKIYKVEKCVVDEHAQVTPIMERFFDSFEKTDVWINECLASEKEHASKVVYRVGVELYKINILRIVKQFFGKGGYCHRYIVSEVEVA